jgi:hypothetical protein
MPRSPRAYLKPYAQHHQHMPLPSMYQHHHIPSQDMCLNQVPTCTMHHASTCTINHVPQQVHQPCTKPVSSTMYHNMCINHAPTMYTNHVHQPCTCTSICTNHVPTMHINHVHQHIYHTIYHTMYHKPYAKKCISTIYHIKHQSCTIYHTNNHMHICTMSSMKHLKEPMHVPHAYITIQHEHPSTMYKKLKDMNYNNHVICCTSHKSAPHSTNQPTYTISKYKTNHTKNASSIHHIIRKNNHQNKHITIPKLL